MTAAGVPNFSQRLAVKAVECAPSGDWAQHAACHKDLNPLWITTPNPATRPHQIELADEICGRCPVRGACRDWALSGLDFEGVAGGLLWPSAGSCAGGHRRRGRRDAWCAGCQI